MLEWFSSLFLGAERAKRTTPKIKMGLGTLPLRLRELFLQSDNWNLEADASLGPLEEFLKSATCRASPALAHHLADFSQSLRAVVVLERTEEKQNIPYFHEFDILMTTFRVLVQRTKSQVSELKDNLSEKQEHLQVLVDILRSHESPANFSENEKKACTYLLSQLQVPLGSFGEEEPPTPRNINRLLVLQKQVRENKFYDKDGLELEGGLQCFPDLLSAAKGSAHVMCVEAKDAETEFPVLAVVLLAAAMGPAVFTSVVALVQQTFKAHNSKFVDTLKLLMNHMLRFLQHNLAFKDYLAQAKRDTMILPVDFVLTREHLGSCEAALRSLSNVVDALHSFEDEASSVSYHF